MVTDATTHGHAAAAGNPTNGNARSATSAAPSEIITVATSGSTPRLITAFQPAWHAAAKRTAAKTNVSIRLASSRLARGSALRADTVAGAPRRRRARAPRANPNADRPETPGRPRPYR